MIARYTYQQKVLADLPDDCVTYDNTPENAMNVGWIHCEECVGELSSAKVTHDHHNGIFYFHQ